MKAYNMLTKVEQLANTYQTNMYEKNLEQLRQALTTVREAIQFPDDQEARKKSDAAGEWAGRQFEKLPGCVGGIARLVQLMAWIAENDTDEAPCLHRQAESLMAQY